MSELHSEFGINLDYINVKSEYNDQSKSVKPYFSGSVDLGNVDALQAYLKVQKAELVVFYPELDFDKDPTNDINKPEVDDTTKFDFALQINRHTGKISARVPNRPGGLSQLLDEIRDAGINLTDLEVFARGCEDFAVLTGSFDISNNS